MYRSLGLAAFALTLLIANAATAGELALQRFPLPGHGVLVIAVPDAWQVQVGQPPGDLPPTLKFSAHSGPAFEALITPIWSMDGRAAPMDAASLRKEVESAAEAAKPQAVERALEIKTLKGTSGTGYYFSATDRAPKPGEYKYLTQGIIPIGGLTVTFTILTNDGAQATVDTVLLLLRDASQGNADARSASGRPLTLSELDEGNDAAEVTVRGFAHAAGSHHYLCSSTSATYPGEHCLPLIVPKELESGISKRGPACAVITGTYSTYGQDLVERGEPPGASGYIAVTHVAACE